jgi:hypothetical protein
MATNDAKVLVDSYQLTMMIFKKSRSFPKQYRPTLGRRLEDGAINLTLAIRVAVLASGNDRSPRRSRSLAQASEHLDEIRILLQLSHDLEILVTSAYGDLCEMTATVGRQLGGLSKFHQYHGRAGSGTPTDDTSPTGDDPSVT